MHETDILTGATRALANHNACGFAATEAFAVKLRAESVVLLAVLFSLAVVAPAAAESRSELLAAVDPALEPYPVPEAVLPIGLRAYGLLPAQLLAAGARLYFIADDREHGVELWVSDGTAEGTGMVVDLWPGGESSFPRFLGALGGEVVFWASTPTGGRRLWASDGTAAGTREIADLDEGYGDLVPGADHWFSWRAPQDAPILAGELVFTTPPGGECRVWATDGTTLRQLDHLEQGTCAARPVVSAGRVHYGTWNGTWRSTDGLGAPVPLALPACAGGILEVNDAVALGDGVVLATYCAGVRAALALVPGEAPRRLVEAVGRSLHLLADGDDLYLLLETGAVGFRVLRARPGGPAEEVATVPGAVLIGPLGMAGGALVVQVVEPERIWPQVWAVHPGDGAQPLMDQPLFVGPWGVRRTATGLVLAGTPDDFFDRPSRISVWDLWTTGGSAGTTRRVATFTAPDRGPDGRLRGRIEPHLAVLGDDVLLSADDGGGQQLRALRAAVLEPLECVAAPQVLCLGDGRFEARVRYGNQHSEEQFLGEGEVRHGTADSGYFWFFRPGNLELLVKVLDGVGVNGHHWVFHGPMTNVEYWLQVTDVGTGLTRGYHREPGSLCGGADVAAFPPGPPPGVGAAAAAAPRAATAPLSPATGCSPGAGRLCLGAGGRFQVEVTFRDHRNAPGVERTGHGRAESSDSGAFWFFRPDNVEVLVKVLDGTPVNGHFWIFVGAMTDLAFEVEVLDTETGARWQHDHPQGSLCGTADTLAL